MDWDDVPVIQPPDSTRRALLADLDQEDREAVARGADFNVLAWAERRIRHVTGTDKRGWWYGSGPPAFGLEMADRTRLNMPPISEDRLRHLAGIA